MVLVHLLAHPLAVSPVLVRLAVGVAVRVRRLAAPATDAACVQKGGMWGVELWALLGAGVVQDS